MVRNYSIFFRARRSVTIPWPAMNRGVRSIWVSTWRKRIQRKRDRCRRKVGGADSREKVLISFNSCLAYTAIPLAYNHATLHADPTGHPLHTADLTPHSTRPGPPYACITQVLHHPPLQNLLVPKQELQENVASEHIGLPRSPTLLVLPST